MNFEIQSTTLRWLIANEYHYDRLIDHVTPLPLYNVYVIYYDMASGGEEVLGHHARQLTKEEAEELKRDTELVSDFKRNKLEIEAKKHWDLFYKRNSTHFFKDRHWITREFPELLQTITELGSRLSDSTQQQQTKKRLVLLEAGCGVGNTVFPVLEDNSNLFIHACDFSPRAIDLVKVCMILVVSLSFCRRNLDPGSIRQCVN